MSDTLYQFYCDPCENVPSSLVSIKPWKVLIVDDEPSVHELTCTVLREFVFESRPLEFLSAYSAAEAKAILLDNPDVALILLDVVMETDNAGLLLVKTIRDELKNSSVRIILRTGQPGKAVERSVIVEYDINDYKEKTELTFQKLFTSVVSSLRSYRDIQIIGNHRRKLELVLRASPELFGQQDASKFPAVILDQLLMVLNSDHPASPIFGYAIIRGSNFASVITPTGEYNTLADYRLFPFPGESLKRIQRCFDAGENLHQETFLASHFHTVTGTDGVIYLESENCISDFDRHLVDIYLSNVGNAFDNLSLNREIEDTQKEIIYTIGEMIERRSLETSYHVKRVSEVARIIALKLGLSEAESRVIAMAAPMHDVGKLGIPDSILHKPGKLDSDEIRLMQTHSATGYEILSKSNRTILRAAAEIAWAHHEKWNGEGYPQKLKGTEIPLNARIVAAADVFDSLLSRRSYKDCWDHDQVRDFFIEERGKHFDPAIADVLLDNFDEFMAFRKLISS